MSTLGDPQGSQEKVLTLLWSPESSVWPPQPIPGWDFCPLGVRSTFLPAWTSRGLAVPVQGCSAGELPWGREGRGQILHSGGDEMLPLLTCSSLSAG